MRKLASVGALVALLAFSAAPVSAATGGGGGTGFSSGATIKITGAHLLAKVAIVVDLAITCQPINGNTQLTLGYGPGMTDVFVNITQHVGKTVATGGGTFNGPNTTITCDGTTVSKYQISVLPQGLVPFTRGVAAMNASTFIQDLTAPCCSSPVEQADTGLVAVNVRR